jgi:hypothetical protein
MLAVRLDQDTWQTTVPRRVAPQADEWLASLLLRCDEANYWASRTTFASLLRAGTEQKFGCWNRILPHLIVVPWRSSLLSSFAHLLAVDPAVLLRTTYQGELARLYATSNPAPAWLNPAVTFQVCPRCLAEQRLLRRTLVLPHLTLCPVHQMVLQSHCRCDQALDLFPWETAPFTCGHCGLAWSRLPRIKARPERLRVEQQMLAWYTFFLTHGTPALMRAACNILARLELKQRRRERTEREQEGKMRPSGRKLPESLLHLYQEPSTFRLVPLGILAAELVQHAIALEELTILLPPSALAEGKGT